ncbi:ABC transporter ATP-binding protein [Streptomyces pseudovenezuelae]|uniref:Branched-chain amino acid transport system ATP-binding protein n=1 Tax=Streptomyces pseudovenezuelae TaxID=67350 RepID=A0ABT6LG79_9ACTN|nr:ABC transporter ATP-binding protein [Streptomyces pseudovenezuelae]MDH6214379.1 branched-chain amino acid transport system ATP-binding protein [Streptomyces pseudovenezuelae]
MRKIPAPRTETAATLTVEDLSVHYGGVCAVRSIGFSVEPGASVGIIGANGAGKTSTLKVLMGLVPRSGGRVTLGERDLTRVRARDMVRHGIGYVPEGRHVFPGLSVEKNLLLGAYARRWDDETRATLEEVHQLFPMLREMSGRLAGALSGGQQQMLAIGRALMARPRLLLLDEPSMGLSPKLVGFILDTLQRLREEGLSLLLVEQNAKLTFGATSHCLVMENGTVAMTGTSEELSQDTRVRQIYLGL